MDSLSPIFTPSHFQDDPILQMFLQSKENKDLALDFLNQEALMDDFKNDFMSLYMHSLNAVDNFFLNELQKQAPPLLAASPLKDDGIPYIPAINQACY